MRAGFFLWFAWALLGAAVVFGVGCSSTAREADGGVDAGFPPDSSSDPPTDAKADVPLVLDAGVEGALADVGAGGDAFPTSTCYPDACGPNEFCMTLVTFNSPLDAGKAYCLSIPAKCEPKPTCACVSEKYSPLLCKNDCVESDAGFVVICRAPPPP